MSLRRNTLWNLAGTGLPLLLGAVTIPYLIKTAGVEAFGVLTLVWALIGYFSLFDFGLGRALTQKVAALRSGELIHQMSGLVKTGLWFTAITGVVGGALLAILAYQLAFHFLKVSVVLQPSTYHALLIAAVGIPLTTITTGLRGVLEAYEDFKVVNLLRIGLGAANFGLPALSVMLINTSLVWMVASLVFARAVVMLAHLVLVNQRLPAGWISGKFETSNLKNLLSFGAWMTVSNIISPLMVTADRFVISAVLGAGLVAYYTVPYEALSRVLILPSALTSALFPRLAFLKKNDFSEARRLYKKCLFLVATAMIPICVAIALFAKWGLNMWLGADFSEKSWMVVIIMAVGIMLNGIAFVPFASIQASGDARSTAILHMIELAFYMPCLLVTLNYFGILGAATSWTLRAFLDLIALLFIEKKEANLIEVKNAK